MIKKYLLKHALTTVNSSFFNFSLNFFVSQFSARRMQPGPHPATIPAGLGGDLQPLPTRCAAGFPRPCGSNSAAKD